MIFRFLLVVFLLVPALGVSGQDSARIEVRARVQKEAILLRWAANRPVAWKQTNRYGFWLERYTVVRDGKLLEQPEKKVLTDKPLKAWELEAWADVLERNQYAAVIAQALFGEDFELTGDEADGISRIVNLSEELEQRFTFSLYAADQSFEAACMAGWGWKDMDVKSGERYLYRIIPALPQGNKLRIGSASTYVSIDEYEELPPPMGLAAVWQDRNVMLVWDYGVLSQVYNSYFIEKSADSISYTRLPGSPVMNPNEGNPVSGQRIFYLDTLQDNTQTYYYRVRGITAFGETGPPSKVVSGTGHTRLTHFPQISRSVINADGVLELEWVFDEQANGLIREFRLNRSDRGLGGYETVMEGIAPDRRYLLYSDLKASNYFTISAVPFHGEPRVSHPVLVQPQDSVPPLPPSGLRGSIDTAGIVRLEWQANHETDLLGYRVFRALRREEADGEAISLFDIALPDTIYYDTVDIHNLNPKVYYYVIALDQRYNQSDPSTLLELKKPDVIPPLSPVIIGYRITGEGIEITWVASPDEDVAEHRLMRWDKSEQGEAVVVARIAGAVPANYVDTSVVKDIFYVYSVQAIDSSGLVSAPTPSVTVVTYREKDIDRRIVAFNAVVDRENRMIRLNWSANLKNVREYELYKGEDGKPLILWKVLPADVSEMMDRELFVDVKYRYVIRALFTGGGNSESKDIVIQL